MKRILFLLLCLLCVKMSQAEGRYEPSSSTLSFSGDSIPVIISIVEDDQQLYQSLSVTLKNMPGVHYMAYCSNHAAFLLYVDPDLYSSSKVFTDQLKSATNLSFIKEMRGDLMSLLNFCNYGSAQEAQDLKHP